VPELGNPFARRRTARTSEHGYPYRGCRLSEPIPGTLPTGPAHCRQYRRDRGMARTVRDPGMMCL
jgi:hypothetical protein